MSSRLSCWSDNHLGPDALFQSSYGLTLWTTVPSSSPGSNRLKKEGTGAMEMAPPARCWLFKHEELALAPRHPHKKLSALVPTCNHSARDAETEGSLELAGQASLAKWMRSKFSERPCNKNRKWRVLGLHLSG